MGLFINRDAHREIFKNEGTIRAPNQSFFKWDPLSELLKEQQKVNESLHYSIHKQHLLSKQQGYKQTSRWKEVNTQLTELKDMNIQQETVKFQVVERLKTLENQNRKLQLIMEQERLSEQEMKDQLKSLEHSNQAIVEQLEMGGLANEQIGVKMDEQHDLQKQMADQMMKQEVANEDVLNRLEKQEAVSEKITRQMDHFRAILYERTSYLAGKIEEGYYLTSLYVTQLMTRSDQPTTIAMKEKKREEQKSVN